MLFVRIIYLFIYNEPFLLEMHFIGISDQLNRLGESYVSVLHHLGPFSAGVFRFFYGTLGDHLIYSRLFAFLLGFIQVLIVTTGINKVNGLKDFNAFTGVIHIVLLHLFPDMLILSPILIGMTFITLAYSIILEIIRGRKIDNQNFLLVGVFTSLAGGFLFPLFLFAVPTLFIIVIYTKFDARSIGLFLMGLFVPFVFIFAYYYSIHYALEYLLINMYYGFTARITSELNFSVYTLVIFVPGVLFSFAFVKILALYNMVSYQQKMIVSAIFYLVTGVIIFFLLPDKSIYYFLLLIPFLIHFYALLLIDTRDRTTNYMCIISLIIIVIIPFLNNVNRFSSQLNYSALYPNTKIASYGRVLNLSSDKNILANNKYATGFCEYMIAKSFFIDRSPEATILVYDKLIKDLPDAIYDPHDLVMPKFDQIPELKKKYTYLKEFSIYKRIP